MNRPEARHLRVLGILGGSVLGLLVLFGAGPGEAGELDGRLSLEMEYLGESYFSEQRFTADDLGFPTGTSLTFTDTTRFNDDTWLPGQRLDLNWRTAFDNPLQFQANARTAFNHERLSQDMEFRGEVPAGNDGRWLFLARGALRDDERSLVGHGDWQTRLEASRETTLGRNGRGGLRLGWEHSRTRGDTTSYLYDYDTARGRLYFSRGEGWLPDMEALIEGVVKNVPTEEAGGYHEIRLAGTVRNKDKARSLNWEARVRNYTPDASVGKDFFSTEAVWRGRLWQRRESSIHLETEVSIADYTGEDELYYDSAELQVHVPFHRGSDPWTVHAGPVVEYLADLNGGDRDYWQWTGRGSLSRIFGLGGFFDMNLEAGYRDYRSKTSAVIEVTSLSTSLLRSDFWLVETLALINIPLFGGVSLDFVASSSWEFHTLESERIQVTFATVGIGRSF